MRYRVKKIYHRTEEVVVEANSKSEAEDAAMRSEGEPNNDDWLYDCEVIKEDVDDDLSKPF